MYDPVSAICHEVRNNNFDSAIQQYSIFFQKLLAALFHENRNGKAIGQVLLEIINGDTNYHSVIVHFLYFMKSNDKKYVTTQDCKNRIRKEKKVEGLLECQKNNAPYIFLPPNFNVYLSHSLNVAITDLHGALGNNNASLSEDFLYNYSQLFANALNGYSQCSLNMHTENTIWLQELHLIALLYRYFHLSYQKSKQERNWKDIKMQTQIFELQNDYKNTYEKLQSDALNSIQKSQTEYNYLLNALKELQNKLNEEQISKFQLQSQLLSNDENKKTISDTFADLVSKFGTEITVTKANLEQKIDKLEKENDKLRAMYAQGESALSSEVTERMDIDDFIKEKDNLETVKGTLVREKESLEEEIKQLKVEASRTEKELEQQNVNL